mgnify:CR=1 FL=1
MVHLNSCFFIDIESCLIRVKSGKAFPLSNSDWIFNDEVISHIKDTQYSKVCLIADRRYASISNLRRYERLIDFIKEQLYKILNITTQVIFYKGNDGYFNYPFPGGVLSFVIDNDINLAKSIYVTNNLNAFNYSGVRKGYTFSQFILHG